MPDWLEFDPPGVESNRPTMLTEEKKRGPVLPSLLLLAPSAASPGPPKGACARRMLAYTDHDEATLLPLRRDLSRAGTRISSHFLAAFCRGNSTAVPFKDGSPLSFVERM